MIDDGGLMERCRDGGWTSVKIYELINTWIDAFVIKRMNSDLQSQTNAMENELLQQSMFKDEQRIHRLIRDF